MNEIIVSFTEAIGDMAKEALEVLKRDPEVQIAAINARTKRAEIRANEDIERARIEKQFDETVEDLKEMEYQLRKEIERQESGEVDTAVLHVIADMLTNLIEDYEA